MKVAAFLVINTISYAAFSFFSLRQRFYSLYITIHSGTALDYGGDLVSISQKVFLDGPYGQDIHLENFKTVTLVAEGCGIFGTFPHAMFLAQRAFHNRDERRKMKDQKDFSRSAERLYGDMTRKVNLFWVLELQAQDRLATSELSQLMSLDDGHALLHVYIIYPKPIDGAEDTLRIPDHVKWMRSHGTKEHQYKLLREILVLDSYGSDSSAVLISGKAEFVNAVHKFVHQAGIETRVFKSEYPETGDQTTAFKRATRNGNLDQDVEKVEGGTMSDNNGPLSGRNIAVCGNFKPRTQDEIINDIGQLGGTGFKNKLPDDALCVICTPEAAKTNKTVQEATTKNIPLVSLQWLDDGGSQANLDQYLISRNEDKAEDRRESLSHSTPPQQTADTSQPEIPETRSKMDRYEGNAESAESTPTRKPSTWKDRINSALKSVAGTPQKKSSAAPTAGEAKVSFVNPTFNGKETSENANGPDATDADTGPKAISGGGLEDPSSPTETPSSARRSAAGQSEESQSGGSTKEPIHASSQRPDGSREGNNPNDPITAPSASPEMQTDGRREGSTESNPIPVSSASPETQTDGRREGSTESNPIPVSSASPQTQTDGRREGSTESNPIPVSSASPQTQTDGRREGSTESNPIHVSSESPEPPKTSQASPILKQESQDGNGQQPQSGCDDQDHGRQERHEPQKSDQDRSDQGHGPDAAGDSDKENQEPSQQEPDLYEATPVSRAKQPATQREPNPQTQKDQTDKAPQGQSETSREKQPEPGRVIQSTESAEEVHYSEKYKKGKTPVTIPPKAPLFQSNSQGQSAKGLRSPESTTTVVRDDAFNPHKWAETHTIGGNQMERHPKFSDWRDFPQPNTGLWIEIDDFEEPDRKIWVLARGITYKNQLAVESIGFKEGQSRGLSLSAAAYKSEIAALRRKGIGQFLPGEARDFTGIKGRNRWNDAQHQNAFNVVFFAEAHGEKNNGDCLVVYDGGKALSKTDIIKAGGIKWGRIIESHRRPEISVAPGKAPWPEESVARAAPTAMPPATRLASSPPAAMLPTPKSVGQARFVHTPQAVPRPGGGVPLQRSSTERTQRAAFPPVSSLSPVPAAPQPSATPTAPMGFPPTVVPPAVVPSTRPPPMNMAQGFQQPVHRQFPGPQNWMQPQMGSPPQIGWPPQMGWPPQDFVSYQQRAAPPYMLPPSQSAYSTRDVSMDPSSSFRDSSQPAAAFQAAREPPNLKHIGRVVLKQNADGEWRLDSYKVFFPDGRTPPQPIQVDWETDGLNHYARTFDRRLWRVEFVVNP
ncbi:hypothetical protein GQ607_013810 [Colletotrichum asianum]|uniref:BRCT domain-containing protein n=1 Tax=Colletotrichum asianum TaxID=702518 RepID=A0A8H3ZMC1_9PEZI|nr:hypothetical protein GQ607_013810 [Colletotrichum asianum]